MPLLDVSELLSDPDFSTVFDVVRSVESVDDHGYAAHTETTLSDVIGVVVAAQGQTLTLLDDGSRVSDAITVYTKTPLYAAINQKPADQIIWKGNRYVVKVMRNWGDWGQGFYAATCEFVGVNP